MSNQQRILLSPPHVGERERSLLLQAFDSNWLAPLGPHVDAFELEFAERVQAPYAVALSSGTAALHLALIAAGIQPGDAVITTTSTFIATANAIRHAGAKPVFVDCEPRSWAIDPTLVDQAAENLQAAGTPATAVVAVDVYGQCADYDALRLVARKHNLRLIADAAESLGATYGDRPAGSLADISCFSFNGNKIITTSGGGMVTTHREDWATRIRHLASQSKVPGSPSEHSEVGYNYRLSNLLAAVGRGQLEQLDRRARQRQAINQRYRKALEGMPGVKFMPNAAYGKPTNWLTCLQIDATQNACTPAQLIDALAAEEIESRPVWKPLHQQAPYRGPVLAKHPGRVLAEQLGREGVCLPSGSSLSEEQQDRVIGLVQQALRCSSTATAA